MKSRPCARGWQAEAAEDGRLSPADRASFERHAETCRACARERDGLARLRAVADRVPVLESTPLRRRQMHLSLLQRANQIQLGAERRYKKTFSAALAAAALATFVVAGVLLLRLPLLAPRAATQNVLPAAPVLAEPTFEIVTSPEGRWHRARAGASLRLAVARGTYTIFVNPLRAGQRFVVELPDGELEVRGTRFVIDLDSATRRVAVSEGLVVLRLSGHPERSLAAGQAWNAPPPPALLPAGAKEPPASPARDVPKRLAKRATSDGAPQPAAAASGSPSAQLPSGASDFAEAMAAFSRGDFATAERLFVAFEANHPRSGHVEDTTFLRAVARSRRGDLAGARALARAYLQRYPNGFRVKEAEQMAR